ncbi:MAG: polyprenol monophosphomannose synthase [Patescibacteria group bacterium]
MSRVVIVTPTYNERKNIGPLIEAIFKLGIPELSLVVADDNSPDGTADVAEVFAGRYPVRVIRRTGEKGLGRAYIEAFRDVMSRENPDYIIQMDADLSHDPAAIPLLLHAAESADVVIGSRYIGGGQIENWELSRRLVSRFGNFYARMVLWLPYRDLTGGFRCFQRKVIDAVPFEKVGSVGYNFMIETLWHIHRGRFFVVEVPIIFRERKEGVSKFNIGIMIECFWRVLKLRFRG